MSYITLSEIAISTSITAVGVGIYVGSLLSLSGLSALFSEKIKYQDHLMKIIEEESKKLKITMNDTEIIWENSNEGTAHLTCYKNKTQDITFYKGDSRSTVRHELYHYYTKHHKHLLTKQFNEETRAILYESLRIKL